MARKTTSSDRSSRSARSTVVRETALAYGAETVGVRELRQNLSVYLDQVKQGRSLLVTEHGQRVAELRPPPAESRLERLVAQGDVTPPTRRVQELLPVPDLHLEKPLSEIIIEMRDEERW